jgi:hypothetical protein
MALATIRRMAMELRLQTEPGELELWMRRPLEGLGGLSAMQALELPQGEQQVRLALLARVGAG